jgi:hypothetical protein
MVGPCGFARGMMTRANDAWLIDSWGRGLTWQKGMGILPLSNGKATMLRSFGLSEQMDDEQEVSTPTSFAPRRAAVM